MSDAKKRRRRFKQTVPLADRLRAAADLARRRAEHEAGSIQRDDLLKKALAAENVAQLDNFLTGGPQRSPAPGRAPPKK